MAARLPKPIIAAARRTGWVGRNRSTAEEGKDVGATILVLRILLFFESSRRRSPNDHASILRHPARLAAQYARLEPEYSTPPRAAPAGRLAQSRRGRGDTRHRKSREKAE